MGTAFIFTNFPHILLGHDQDLGAASAHLYTSPAGLAKSSSPGQGAAPLRWTADFGSLVFAVEGKDCPAGGLNERGFAATHTSLPGEIGSEGGRGPEVEGLQLIQYLLDTCQDVHSALVAAHRVHLTHSGGQHHYLIGDRFGDSALIEFLDGSVQVFHGETLPVPAMVERPYQQSIAYLKEAKKSDLDPASSALSRFALANRMCQAVDAAPLDLLKQSFTALERLSLPSTDWLIVYDLTNLITFLRRPTESALRLVDLRRCALAPDKLPTQFDLETPGAGDLTGRFLYLE
jgi:hypothetical protein